MVEHLAEHDTCYSPCIMKGCDPMCDLYPQDSYCMEFTNEEIETYLLAPLRGKLDILVKPCSGERLPFYQGSEKIEWVSFDGPKDNFAIAFYRCQTSIYATDETPGPNRTWTYNMDFMFIDDLLSRDISGSDTYGNVVYEGTLRDKTHEEILTLLRQFILVLSGIDGMEVRQTFLEEAKWRSRYSYAVTLSKPSHPEEIISYENILFRINPSTRSMDRYMGRLI